jgi:multicomponent Na+:H+ antiporter subunit G
MNEIVAQILIGLGSVFVFLGAAGLLKMPDSLTRMQVLTKGTTLGVLLVMLGAAFHFGSRPDSARALLVVAFIGLTTPVGAHMLARAAMRRSDSRSRMSLISNEMPDQSPGASSDESQTQDSED